MLRAAMRGAAMMATEDITAPTPRRALMAFSFYMPGAYFLVTYDILLSTAAR